MHAPYILSAAIWAISLEFYRELSILAADDFLGACYRKAMTPKKLWTLLFPIRDVFTRFSACAGESNPDLLSPWSHKPVSLNGCLGNSEIGGCKEIR